MVNDAQWDLGPRRNKSYEEMQLLLEMPLETK